MGKTNRPSLHAKLATALTLSILATASRVALADAAAYYWQSPQNGNFESPAAWAMPDQSIPTATSNVTFNTNSPTPYTVTLAQDHHIFTMTVLNDNLTLNLGSHTLSMNGLILDGTMTAFGGTITTYGVSVGQSNNATFNLTNGGILNSSTTYIGDNAATVATATVDGPGSTWNASNGLYVGQGGTGILNITNGATVVSAPAAYAGAPQGTYVGPSGFINFGPHGGTLNTGSLYASPSQLSGTGTINATGLVSDTDLAFDSSHGLAQAFSWGNVTVNLNQNASSDLGAGNLTSGTLTIKDGSQITSTNGYLGYNPGSSGSALITGPGSNWTTTYQLVVGCHGSGSLIVNNGASLTSYYAGIGGDAGSASTLTVDGPTSTWNTGDLSVGGVGGAAALNITNGATVTSKWSAGVGASGSINFGSQGGTLTTPTLYALPSQVTGTGTINTNGLVSDIDIVFDSSHGLAQTFSWGNVTVNLNQSATSDLGAGLVGSGTLTIKDGFQVTSGYGTLGSSAGSSGTATVTGCGSSWAIAYSLYVGNSGTGTLNITQGGNVTSHMVDMTSSDGHASSINVDGPGSSWTNSDLFLVYGGNLNITHGATVTTGYSQILSGKLPCVVTVDGPGSAWTVNDQLNIGGTSTINITNGATVVCSQGVYLQDTSSVNFGPNGGTLTTTTLIASPSQLSGAGTVNVTGLISDIDLLFDSAHGLSQTFSIGHVTVNLNQSASGELGVGNLGSGTITIKDGVQVASFGGYLSVGASSSGTATITGPGSSWSVGNTLAIGCFGTGVLNITHGGSVSSPNSFVGGYYSDETGTGTVTIDGSGSIWNSGTLHVNAGQSGTSTLHITKGGSLTSSYTSIGSGSSFFLSPPALVPAVVTVDGLGSTWTTSGPLYIGQYGAGTLRITNGGTVACVSATYVASYGSINFGPGGGTLTSGSLYASPSQLTGTGTINTAGLVSDMAFVFDSTHGPAQTLSFGSVTVNLNQSSSGDLGAGNIASGSLTIMDAVQVSSANGYLGYNSGSSGIASITGPGSTWTIGNRLFVGGSGTGTLNITDGGCVTSAYACVGGYSYSAAGSGTVTVDGAGSTWSSNNLSVGSSRSTTLNITHGGVVNSSCSSIQALDSATTIVAVDGPGSTWNSGNLYVGMSGAATLNITNGGTVTSSSTYIACNPGTTATVTVDGPGSTWINSCELSIGMYSDMGTLKITRGGTVNSSFAMIGNYSATGTVTVDGCGTTWHSGRLSLGSNGATGTLRIIRGGVVTTSGACIGDAYGFYPSSANTATPTDAPAPTLVANMTTSTVTVDGPASTWNNSGDLAIGATYGSGTLSITHGGTVTANSLTIQPNSLLALDIGLSSSLTLANANGLLTNNGGIRLTADPNAAPGSYIPINATMWSGTGVLQALGGSWNPTTYTFTITAPAIATAGTTTTIDLSTTQRLLITDPATHKTVSANFQPTSAPTPLTFSATPITGTAQTLLHSTANQNILAAWAFSLSSAYAEGDPVYLSLAIGPGYSPDELTIWHFDGTLWTPFTPTDLSYDGQYADFTVTGFSSYAVTAVPEPASFALLALAALPLLRRRR